MHYLSEVTAPARWAALTGLRHGFITRCERYAGYTIRKLCLPDGYEQTTTEMNRDFNSLGAHLVNNLTNKIMLAMFAPSRPFFRYDLSREDKAKLLGQTGLSEPQLTELFSGAEKEAVKQLDVVPARPKLYEAQRHLIVTGNCLLWLDPKGKDIRVLGIKRYCVKRSESGKVLEIIVWDPMKADELDPALQPYAMTGSDLTVNQYIWIRWNGEQQKYVEEYWIDNQRVTDPAYQGMYSEERMPWHALTWDLSDDSDYGTGLVEEYAGDFQAVSTLSEAEINAAILASEFRWLANPAGQTRVEDLQSSQNGEVLPGFAEDVTIVSAGQLGQNITAITGINDSRIRRLGAGFLMNSAVTRDAERVTAEEIRLQAQELEQSLGGVYSRLAQDMQGPIAYWLTRIIDLKIEGMKVQAVVITGLDALSRNGDLENVRLFLQDVITVTNLPEPVLMYLKLDTIFSALASGRGLASGTYVRSDQEVKQMQAQAQQMAMQQEQTLIATEAGAKAATQRGNV